MFTKATLKKISEHLNLSISTVSRALKDHPDIAETTKQKVRELAAVMEYEPNTHAISLRTNSSRLFGLIVPSISNLFYESVVAAAEKRARENDYSLMIFQSGNDPEKEQESLKLCRLNRVAGIMIAIVPGSQPEIFKKLQESKIPVVFLDKVPDDEQYDKVCMADEEAAALAAERLINQGKKRILALFGNAEMSITKKRLKVFSDKIDRAGVNCELHFALSSNEAAAITNTAIESFRPDALFTMSDELLIGAMQTLYARQVPIPGEIAVLSMSNGYIPTLFNPRITFVETSGTLLGEMATQRLLDFIGGQKFARSLTVPARLVEGKSC